jgi:hypothetical protein
VGSSPTSGTYRKSCKGIKTQSKAKGQDSNPGPFYTNYYTNALRQRLLHCLGGLALHCG